MLAEHEVVADVERLAAVEAPVVRMSPAPAVGLPRHMTSQLRFRQVIGPHEFQDRGVFVLW